MYFFSFPTVWSFLELCKCSLFICNNSNGWLFVIHTFKTTAITVIHLNIAPALHFCHLKCLWSFSFQLRQQKLLRLLYLYVKYYAHFDCKHWTLNEKNISFICKGHSLYQVTSKMLPGSKVITFILWHLKNIGSSWRFPWCNG